MESKIELSKLEWAEEVLVKPQEVKKIEELKKYDDREDEKQAQIIRMIEWYFKQAAKRDMTNEELIEYRKLWRTGTPDRFTNFQGNLTNVISNLTDYCLYKKYIT